MNNLTTVAVILAMIALGALLIHLLNRGHAERISAFHYSRSLRGDRAARDGAPPQQSGGTPEPSSGTAVRRDHRDGGRGRIRPSSMRARARRM